MKNIFIICILFITSHTIAQHKSDTIQNPDVENNNVIDTTYQENNETIKVEKKSFSTITKSTGAEFPGGVQSLKKLVESQIILPDEIPKNSTLKIYVSFVVNTNGNLSDITIEEDPGYNLKDQTIKAFYNITTKWKPAFQDGIPISQKYKLQMVIHVLK